jgi:hypothetical protein
VKTDFFPKGQNHCHYFHFKTMDACEFAVSTLRWERRWNDGGSEAELLRQLRAHARTLRQLHVA